VFNRFGQLKLGYAGLVLDLSQFSILPQVPQKMMLTSKVVRIDSKYLSITLYKSGMHNIRPAGQMWHAEAVNLTRETPNFVYFVTFFLLKTPFECVKTYQLWPLDKSKKIFLTKI